MTWWAVVNPAAGKRSENAEERTRRVLALHRVDAEVRVSDSAHHADELVSEGVALGHDRFIAVGGDGTVHLAVNALMRHHWAEPPTLAILPAGTGSDFIRTFGIPQDMEKAAARLDGDDTYQTDVGLAIGSWGERYFLNEVQAGVGAEAARRAARLTRLGTSRYTLAFWLSLPAFPYAEVELRVGDKHHRGRAIDVVCANGQFFAGGMNIAPRATVVDGQADVQVFATAKSQALTVFPRVIKGMHLSHPTVRRFEGSEFSLETDPPWPVEADGEYLGTTPLRGHMIAGAIKFKI